LNNAYLIDAHLHQYTAYNYFQYQECGSNLTGGINCSSFQSDLIELTPLMPTSPVINKPVNTTLIANGIGLFINYSASIPISSATITNYNIVLLNSDYTINKTRGIPIIKITLVGIAIKGLVNNKIGLNNTLKIKGIHEKTWNKGSSQPSIPPL